MKKLILIVTLGLVFGVATSAYATITPISYPSYGERWLNANKPDGTLSILEYLFGPSNWARIDDNLDQLWSVSSGAGVRAVAKQAGSSQNLWAGTQNLFTISGGDFVSLTSGATASITSSGAFRFQDNSNSVFWSSIPSENPDGIDHMVTFKITSHGGTNYDIGDYVIAFENRSTAMGGDFDYNDIVFRLHNTTPTTPEPASVTLLGFGLVGLIGRKLKRKFMA